MASGNYIKNVAIIGAGGNSGRHMTEALLKTGKHTVTAITRAEGGTSNLPSGVTVRKVDYSDPATLVAALQGQDALVITLGGMAPEDTQTKLIEAAAEAGVPWVLPNEWTPDSANEGLLKDMPTFHDAFAKMPVRREMIAELGKSAYVAISTGFWIEQMLAVKFALGFDFEKREVTLFDDGETKMSVSTLPQVGRAVAALLSLPIKLEAGDSEHCLEHFRNGRVYVSSFTVSQRDLLDAVLRVTGTQLSDWKSTSEPVRERYDNGMAAIKRGQLTGYARAMASRVFFPDGSGDFEKSRGTVNAMLGLPKEDLDEFVKITIEKARTLPWNKME